MRQVSLIMSQSLLKEFDNESASGFVDLFASYKLKIIQVLQNLLFAT